ncbi:hypothetical protein SNK03_007974 [Fusarium graminearum]
MAETFQPAGARPVNFSPSAAHHQAALSHHDSFPGNSRSLDELMILKPYFAGQPKSLSGIAMRAFCLGIALASSGIAMTTILVMTSSPAWRVPFFLFSLSAFHFLEFWTTAEKNPLVASIGSFLLTANWPGYAIAHSAAFLECAIVNIIFPERNWAPFGIGSLLLVAGLLMVTVGQYVRSVAMLQAGASFNHHVQTRKKDSHELVTTGIYSIFRHPSYFGFFYWGLGTQLVMGNVLCFFAYAFVLWKFFNIRIKHEEGKLIEFFKDDYVQYRKRVGTKIPFIA